VFAFNAESGLLRPVDEPPLLSPGRHISAGGVGRD
jgi:hypothetical protein